MQYDIILKHQPRRSVAVVKFRATVAEMGQRIGAAFEEVSNYLVQSGALFQGPAVAYFIPGPSDFDVSAGFVVSAAISGDGNVVPAELPECDAVVTTHLGGYDTLPAAHEAMQSWMRANGHEPSEEMWEEYWSDPSTPPEQTRTDIVWPVKGVVH